MRRGRRFLSNDLEPEEGLKPEEGSFEGLEPEERASSLPEEKASSSRRVP